MAICPDALPTDAAALTEMVLALDAENEKLRAAMRTLKEMIFGKRSERLAVLVAEQLALELADLETDVTLPAAANDDHLRRSRWASGAARRHGATSARCPSTCRAASRCIEPETTACPCCQGRLHKIGQDVSEVLDVIPAILRVLRMIRPKYGCRGCRWRGPGESPAAADREQHGVDRAGDPRGGLEVCLVSAAVPAGADPGRPGHPSRPRDARRLGEACRLVARPLPSKHPATSTARGPPPSHRSAPSP